MTTRRVFLASAIAATAAAALSNLARAESAGHTSKLKTRDGAELFVRDTGGNGRAVVMTHAWPLSSAVWDFQATTLSKAGFRIITYDRRGFGQSSQPAGGYDFDTFADDLAAVIDQSGVRDAMLVGYSMGGGEVVRYFSRHKGRHVSRAALVGAAAHYLLKAENNPGGIDGAVFDGIKQGVLGDRKAYLAGLLSDVFLDAKRPATNPVTPEMVDATLAMAMQAGVAASAACVDAFSKTDFRAELASVNVPTLVLHGTADIPVPFAMAKATADGIAKSKLIEYRDASHGIVLTERDRVASDLLGFMAG
jgi:pimeloyl-ACP methyl ester carboxylesterase